MNYRHAYHAGNFADAFKHIVLGRILTHLARKEAPFRVIDTHAGTGRYSLDSDQAGRTGEWRAGVGLVAAAELSPELTELMQPWLGMAHEGLALSPRLYSGSPDMAARLTRAQDRLSLFELHPEDAELLRDYTGPDRRIKVFEADGWKHLAGQLPPPEKRGLVFIDPPFEEPNELRRITEALAAATPRWNNGVYAVWYPIKAMRDVEAFARRMAALPVRTSLRVEITRYRVNRIDRLNGCGLIILNPPWKLDAELATIGPALARLFAIEDEGHFRLEWLKAEG